MSIKEKNDGSQEHRPPCPKNKKATPPKSDGITGKKYFYSFIVSGCIGLLQNWVENRMAKSPEQMASLAEQMIMTGIKIPKNKT